MLEKLPVVHLQQVFPTYTEPEGSLQQPATGPYPEPDKLN